MPRAAKFLLATIVATCPFVARAAQVPGAARPCALLVAFDAENAQWGSLPIRRVVAARMLAHPDFARRYASLYAKAQWLRSREAALIASALLPQLADARGAMTDAVLTKTHCLMVPPIAMLRRAQSAVGVAMAADVEVTYLAGLPELRPEPLVDHFARFHISYAEEIVDAALTRHETGAIAAKLNPLSSRFARQLPLVHARKAVAQRLLDVYEDVVRRFAAEQGNPPWRTRTLRDAVARLMSDHGASRLKSRKLQMALLERIFLHAQANEDDEWSVEDITDSVALALEMEARDLAAEFEARERREAAAASPPTAPSLPLTQTPPPVGFLTTKRQRLESVEERAERIRREQLRRAERLRRVSALLFAAADATSERTEAPPEVVAAPEAPRLSLEEIVETYALDDLARRQILAALASPSLGETNRVSLHRTLSRLLDGTSTFELRPNLVFAHDFRVWEIRPQRSSNFRMALQLAGNRPYLIALEEVKDSLRRQVSFFRDARDRWEAFRNPVGRR